MSLNDLLMLRRKVSLAKVQSTTDELSKVIARSHEVLKDFHEAARQLVDSRAPDTEAFSVPRSRRRKAQSITMRRY